MGVGASDAALNIVLGSRDETGPGIVSAEGKISKLKGMTAGAVAAWSGYGAAASTAAGFLSDAAQAAADDAASTDRLRQAVENSGASWKDSQGTIEARIKAGQDLAFSDDDTRDSLSLLIAQTGSLPEALKRQTLAMDVARGMHIDLHDASKLLGKSTAENADTFAKTGLVIDKGATQVEVFAALQKKFGGQASAHAKSAGGQIEIMKDRINEWKESIGSAMGPAMPFVAMLPGMSQGFSAVGLFAGPAAAGIKAIGESSAFAALKAGIVRGATLAWTGVQWLLNAALSANPIGLVVLAVAGLALGIYLAYQKITPFREAVDKAWGAIKTFAGAVWEHVKPALDWLWDMLQKVGGLVSAVFTLNLSGIASSLHNLHIPGFDWGGTVPGSPGSPQMILAHGGEEVLTRGESAVLRGRGGQQLAAVGSMVNVEVKIGTYVGDASKLSKLLAHELRLAGAF